MAYKINLGEKKGIFIVTCIVLILTILLKSFMTKWNVQENSIYAFIQNFLIFIPGLRLNPMTLSTVGDFISGALGILASIYFLVLFQKSVLYKNYIIVSLITASLVDFWPWRSFQNISYSLEGSARWIKDYPVMPYSDSQNVVLTVIFFLMGILSSWILIKIHNQRIILVHE